MTFFGHVTLLVLVPVSHDFMTLVMHDANDIKNGIITFLRSG